MNILKNLFMIAFNVVITVLILAGMVMATISLENQFYPVDEYFHYVSSFLMQAVIIIQIFRVGFKYIYRPIKESKQHR
ncbi:hypothetical protein L4D09_13610 [Photobacterium makurazakiensis]|uniref:hypothetical protein n=1 Tax=Photobacterium makurazakiensis TaxID=2910234 RepID=UPI003D0D810C